MSVNVSYLDAELKAPSVKNIMARRSKQALVIVSLLFFFALAFSGNSLRQGQEIKQFYSYSMTQALAQNGFAIFRTYLPCTDVRDGSYPRPWGEEPPIFSLFAAGLSKVGLTEARWASLVVGLAFSLLTAWLLLKFLAPGLSAPVLLLTSLGVPIFMRHYYQHMPDLMAALWILAAVLANLYRREGLFIGFLVLAVTTKAYAAFPAVALLTYAYLIEPYFARKTIRGTEMARFFLFSILITLPFFAWIYTLNVKGIPSAFDFRQGLSNRHSGSWSTLFTKRYYDMFLTFVGTKGVGWVLFVGFWVAIVKFFRRFTTQDRLHGLLAAWALSFVPFWILVRDASLIHDHYVLHYFLPIAILGAEQVLRITNLKIRYLLIAVSVVIALGNPVSWRLRAENRPPGDFCDQEVGALMKTPKQ